MAAAWQCVFFSTQLQSRALAAKLYVAHQTNIWVSPAFVPLSALSGYKISPLDQYCQSWVVHEA